ncbi:MAG: threonine synthase [Acidobacteria bacterium]|nr:threonine synthase [Acidobacteriota bacterium]MBV9475500.1 threonine synthase [Acidobacteriota bacterium]
MTEWLQCIECGTRFDILEVRYTCSCGNLLSVERDGIVDRDAFDDRRTSRAPIDQSGVWRFREGVLNVDRAITHPEGATRLYERMGLLFKHEGENPTGSFKDRGMTVAVTQAVRVGARAVACASTGNTSASLAAYAAQAGLRAIVFVPAGKVASGKLAQTLAYGATVLQIRGDFDAAMRLVREACDRLGIYLVNSINPFRIEGQKTIVWELLQDLDWSAPDWIVVPAGNLGNTSAFGKALREAHAHGWIARMPRLASIQAHGANPFYRSFTESFGTRHRIAAETVASAIRIGDPVSHDKAVAAIRDTNGVVEEVTDAEILAAKRTIDGLGIGCEPASAATLAGVTKLKAAGVMREDERIVCVLTGNILKDPEANYRAENVVEIDASIEAVERVLA